MAESKKDKSAAAEPRVYALLTVEQGSYTLGEYRIQALKVTPVPESVAGLADEAESPVKFHAKPEAAEKALQAMLAKIETRTSPKAQ
jgi:hypothetical protein